MALSVNDLRALARVQLDNVSKLEDMRRMVGKNSNADLYRWIERINKEIGLPERDFWRKHKKLTFPPQFRRMIELSRRFIEEFEDIKFSPRIAAGRAAQALIYQAFDSNEVSFTNFRFVRSRNVIEQIQQGMIDMAVTHQSSIAKDYVPFEKHILANYRVSLVKSRGMGRVKALRWTDEASHARRISERVCKIDPVFQKMPLQSWNGDYATALELIRCGKSLCMAIPEIYLNDMDHQFLDVTAIGEIRDQLVAVFPVEEAKRYHQLFNSSIWDRWR